MIVLIAPGKEPCFMGVVMESSSSDDEGVLDSIICNFTNLSPKIRASFTDLSSFNANSDADDNPRVYGSAARTTNERRNKKKNVTHETRIKLEKCP